MGETVKEQPMHAATDRNLTNHEFPRWVTPAALLIVFGPSLAVLGVVLLYPPARWVLLQSKMVVDAFGITAIGFTLVAILLTAIAQRHTSLVSARHSLPVSRSSSLQFAIACGPASLAICSQLAMHFALKDANTPEVMEQRMGTMDYKLDLLLSSFGPLKPHSTSADPIRQKATDLYNAGIDLALTGELQKSEAKLTAVVELVSDDAKAYLNLGLVLDAQGKIDAAIVAYRNAMRLSPDYAEAYANLGAALHASGNTKDAIEAHKKAITLDPELAIAHHNLALALIGQGKPDDAIAHFREAIRLDPAMVPAHVQLGVQLGMLGDLVGAREVLYSAIRLNRLDVDGHYNLGVTLLNAGDLEGAMASFRDAIRVSRDHMDSYLALAKVLNDLQKADEARSIAREATVFATTAEQFYALGVLWEMLGDKLAASDSYKRATRLDPTHKWAYLNRAAALRQSGRPEEAVVELKMALRIDDQFAEANFNLAIALGALGRVEEAEKAMREACRIQPDIGSPNSPCKNLP